MTVLFKERRSLLSTSNIKLAWSHSDSYTDSDLQATQYNHSLIYWPLSSCTGAAMVKGLVLGHLRGFLITDCDQSVLRYVRHLLCLPFGAGQIVMNDFFAKTSCLWTLTERVVRLSQNSLAKSRFVKQKPWAKGPKKRITAESSDMSLLVCHYLLRVIFRDTSYKSSIIRLLTRIDSNAALSKSCFVA